MYNSSVIIVVFLTFTISYLCYFFRGEKMQYLWHRCPMGWWWSCWRSQHWRKHGVEISEKRSYKVRCCQNKDINLIPRLFTKPCMELTPCMDACFHMKSRKSQKKKGLKSQQQFEISQIAWIYVWNEVHVPEFRSNFVCYISI